MLLLQASSADHDLDISQQDPIFHTALRLPPLPVPAQNFLAHLSPQVTAVDALLERAVFTVLLT